MTDLPKYQRIPDVEQGVVRDKVPSLAEEADAEVGGADLGAVYPPPAGNKRIELCFRPRHPCTGVSENAYGALGRTKDETVAIARAAFPPLRDFPPERVEFMLLSSDDETWQRLLPNVWETVIDDPPAKLGVRIADSPGDAEERERLRAEDEAKKSSDCRLGCGVFGGLLLIILILLYFAIRH